MSSFRRAVAVVGGILRERERERDDRCRSPLTAEASRIAGQFNRTGPAVGGILPPPPCKKAGEP